MLPPRTTFKTLVLAGGILILFAAPATADVLRSKLRETKAREVKVKTEIKRLDRKAEVLTTSLTKFSRRIDQLEAPIAELNGRIADLQAQISNRNQRIAQLRVQYAQQKKQIRLLASEQQVAERRMVDRLVMAYKRGNDSYGTWIMGSKSIFEALDRQEVAAQISTVDKTLVDSIAELERKVRVKRARNHMLRRDIAADIAQISADEREIAASRDRLVGKLRQLEAVRAERQAYLNKIEDHEDNLEGELDQLADDSSALAEAIRTGQTTLSAAGGVPGGISSSGMLWPVNGPVVSTFGPRWGRMHEGLDIAAPSGTPLRAALSGIVTHAGWMGGYGQLVIVQHAGSLSTAYAHQSQISVANGQFVSQGQVIGFVGCTGHCFGDHVHFETRIGGSAVNPMNYL